MARSSSRLLRSFGKRVRQLRLERKFSLQALANQAGLSRRFLVEIEAGRANPSLEKMAALAHSLELPLGQLCDLQVAGIPTDRIALLGIRGAGKSTLGPRLAAELEVPFQELDRLIEDAAGTTTREIFETEGRDGFLRREASALEAWLQKNPHGVLALPGSIVSHTDAYARLLATCTTVWLHAESITHWNRVTTQDGKRPPEGQRQAIAHMEQLLAQRRSAYERAEFSLDTTHLTPEEAVLKIEAFLEEVRED
ncbi:MAG: shikimate kinase [Planctomycetota bacterium]